MILIRNIKHLSQAPATTFLLVVVVVVVVVLHCEPAPMMVVVVVVLTLLFRMFVCSHLCSRFCMLTIGILPMCSEGVEVKGRAKWHG